MKLPVYHLLFFQILFLIPNTFSQVNSINLKAEALKLMKDERYGEAIDQWNKYVSANPTYAEGFNLRGICYEKRGNYEYAVYDFRTARKLKSSDDEIISNLNRATSNWYKLLYNKIEGHKREIAINPAIAKNYLEIGKCYKNLGDWNEAEIWYDLYLEKEFASTDEIIRYSEILSKNNHIAKGEPILKTYTEKFYNDHRIWSRYGYFVLWLGKDKLAIDAFTNSLEIRPYFKEALDGLDLAKGKGYIYSINDTTGRFDFGTPKTKFEYAIDKYYRQLKKNPENDELRFKLINELVKANRYEEAFDQLKILSPNYSEETRFKELWAKVTSLRKSYYADKIKYYEDILSKNPNDKKALLELAKFYNYNGDYSSAANLYKSYLERNPEDAEVKYKLTEVLMWQNKLCEAVEVADNLVSKNPDNEKYLLLAAKINYWLDNNSNYTHSLYQRVLEKNPANKEALFGDANLLLKMDELTEAKDLIDRISTFDDSTSDYLGLINNYNFAFNQNTMNENFRLLEKARNFSSEKDYYSSIQQFKQYLEKNPTNKSVNLELADVFIADNQMDEAEKIYKSLLKTESDFEVEKRLAKVHLWDRDSLVAVNDFKKLNQIKPDEIETTLLLGDAYLQAGQTSNARKIYEELLIKSPDSHILKTRLGWLGGSDKFSFDRFPTFIQLKPNGLYFTDNTDFDYSNYGLGFDLGVTNFITLGFGGSRGQFSSENTVLRFNQLKATGYVKFNDVVSGSAAFGQTFFQNDLKENIIGVFLTAQKKKVFNVTGFLNYSDAAFLLYSPFLVNNRLNAYHFGLNAEYRFKNNLLVSGKYSYIDVSDDNFGNQFTARIGKIFNDEITGGYEYYFYTFDFLTTLYWSPKNFEAHSLWIDWTLFEDEFVNFVIGGKVGLIPQNDYILTDFYASFNYQIINSLLLQTRFNTSSSFRSNTGYRANSILVSLIWTL
jgi:Flp pilus assembly protein TadD